MTPWCKTQLSGGPLCSNSCAHRGKRTDPGFSNVVSPESYRMTLKYSLDQVMWFRTFCSCTAFISGYWRGSRVAGENHRYRRLIRCRAAATKEGWESTPASAQHGTHAISGWNKWFWGSSPEDPSRAGLLRSRLIMVIFKLGFIKILQISASYLVWIWFYFLMFYFWETERQNMSRGGAEREGDSRIQSRLWAVSTEPNVGLELTNREIMTWSEVGSQMLNRLSHPGASEFYS